MASNTKTSKKSLYGRAKDYKTALSQAYDQGFKDGYAAYSTLPDVKGARSVAHYGYGKGLKAHKRVDKYQRKAKR